MKNNRGRFTFLEWGVFFFVEFLLLVIGAFLDIFGIYDRIVLYCGAGALVPITSFGHLLVHGAMDMANDLGPLGLSFGIFNLTSAGISIAITVAFILCLIFKPKH